MDNVRAEARLLQEEMERLEFRARMLLAEHRHVVATLREVQDRLEAVSEQKFGRGGEI